ncbi:MAG: ABC transporter permease [Gammaproteobacteria bacterium]|nr:ABC transporter permease [Gammaproteobacteria bacterium]
MIGRAVKAIIGRELTRMLRQRGRLLSAMIRPLIWLLVIGSGFGAMLQQYGAGDYKQFLIPGLLCMVLLFGAMLASLSLVYDKESGVMRMLVIAPFSHYWIILARTVSAAIAGLVQALLLVVILGLMGYLTMPASTSLFLFGLVLTALLCAAFGMVIAVFSKTLDNFAVIMNFVIFPVFFLSGALYPLEHLPAWLKLITLANPFSYGVDLLKHALLPAGATTGMGAEFSILRDILVQIGCIAGALLIACVRFSQAPVMESLASILSGGRRG